MSFKHIGASERAQIEAMLACNTTKQQVANFLGFSLSAICKEVSRNSKPGGFYSHKYAQKQAELRQKGRKKTKLSDPKIAEYIEAKLKNYWTVLNIVDNIEQDLGKKICIETVYNYIYAPENKNKKLWKYLRRHKKKRRKRSAKRKKGSTIKNRVSIHVRPPIVETRSRIGDWELDTVVGSKHQGFIGTFVDRCSRYTLIAKMKNKSAAEMARALKEKFESIPKSKRITMTADNGTEFAAHEYVASDLEIDFFFADPYSSWQRGTNENTNGLIRQFLPKGTDLREVKQEKLDYIAKLLNTRPRRCLSNRTPEQVFNSS